MTLSCVATSLFVNVVFPPLLEKNLNGFNRFNSVGVQRESLLLPSFDLITPVNSSFVLSPTISSQSTLLRSLA